MKQHAKLRCPIIHVNIFHEGETELNNLQSSKLQNKHIQHINNYYFGRFFFMQFTIFPQEGVLRLKLIFLFVGLAVVRTFVFFNIISLKRSKASN